jgi:hypothetical protein
MLAGAVAVMVNDTVIKSDPPPLLARILKPVVARAVVAGLTTAESTPVEVLNVTLLADRSVLTLEETE